MLEVLKNSSDVKVSITNCDAVVAALELLPYNQTSRLSFSQAL